MHAKNLRQLIPVSFLFVAVLSSGCRTGTQLPKLTDMAWWKKSDSVAQSVPPPPARHFSPESSAVAGEGAELKENLNQILNQVAQETESAEEQLERTPYSQPEFYELSESVNFDPITGKLKTAEDDAQSTIDALKEAQQSVTGDLENISPDRLRQVIRERSGGSFTDAVSDAGDRVNETANQLAGGQWRDDLTLPADSGGSFNRTIEAARQSLNQGADDAVAGGGDFISSATQRTAELVGNVTESAGGIRNDATNIVNQTVSNAADRVASGMPTTGGGGSFVSGLTSQGQNLVTTAQEKMEEVTDAINSQPLTPPAGQLVRQPLELPSAPSRPTTTTPSVSSMPETPVASAPQATDDGLHRKVDELQETIRQLQTQLTRSAPAPPAAVRPTTMPQHQAYPLNDSQVNTATRPAQEFRSSVTQVGSNLNPPAQYNPPIQSEPVATTQQRLASLQPNTRLAPPTGQYQSTTDPAFASRSPGSAPVPSAGTPRAYTPPVPPSNTLRGGAFPASYPSTTDSSFGATRAGFNQPVSQPDPVRTVSGQQPPAPPTFDTSPYAPGSIRHSLPPGQ